MATVAEGLDVGATRAKLEAGSTRVLKDFMAGFQEATLRVELPLIRKHWKVFLQRGHDVIVARTRREAAEAEMDLAEEEVAIGCVEQARNALATAFGKTASYEFGAAEGFLATLRLHAVLALIDQLEPFGPWELGDEIELPPFRLRLSSRKPRRKSATA